MLGLSNSTPKVLISEYKIKSILTQQQINLATTNKGLRQILANDIYISLSKYSDTLMIVINQTNSMGSIYKAKLTGQIFPQINQSQQQYEYEKQYEMRQDNKNIEQNNENIEQNNISRQTTVNKRLIKRQKIYQIKCLFGSTQIQFYQLLLRKILGQIFEQQQGINKSSNNKQNNTKLQESLNILLNISLPVKCKSFQQYQYQYYTQIINQIKTQIKQVI